MLILVVSLLCACRGPDNKLSIEKGVSVSKSESAVKPSNPKTVSMKLRQEQSPLRDIELTKEMLPHWLQIELQNTDETIAVGNLLRAPCSEEWHEGVTLNQSLQQGKCQKSIDWVKSVDLKLTQGISVEEILFTMVSPGPFYSTKFASSHLNSNAMVVVSRALLDSNLFRERYDELAAQLPNIKVIVNNNGEYTIMEHKCLMGGHIVSDKVDESSCISHVVGEDKQLIDGVTTSLQLPIWFINGYRLGGIQSMNQFIRTLSLP